MKLAPKVLRSWRDALATFATLRPCSRSMSMPSNPYSRISADMLLTKFVALAGLEKSTLPFSPPMDSITF